MHRTATVGSSWKKRDGRSACNVRHPRCQRGIRGIRKRPPAGRQTVLRLAVEPTRTVGGRRETSRGVGARPTIRPMAQERLEKWTSSLGDRRSGGRSCRGTPQGGSHASRTTCMCLRLALVSGARLLYTNDTALIDDFGNREIVARPRGKIYTTARNAAVTDAHRRLLAARDLCRIPRG